MDAALNGQRIISQALAHCVDILFCKTERLQVGKAVVSLTKVGSQVDGATIGGNTTLLVAHCLQDMAQPNVSAR